MRWSTVGYALLGGTGIATIAALIWPVRSPFISDLIASARADLGVTQSGDPSRVAQMLATYGITTYVDWCAAAVGTWIREASRRAGIAPPIPGSPGAKVTMGQFQAIGRWLDVAMLRADPSRVAPGMVPVWQRGQAGSWMGHIGIVSAASGAQFQTIEGNAGPTGGAVVQSVHTVNDPNLLGMGYFA